MDAEERRQRLFRWIAGGLFVVIVLLIVEVGLRAFTLHPISTTSNLEPDPVLGYRMDRRMSDIDEAGFRNPSVLSRAQLVALGDSQTYGFNATSEEAWPRVLADDLGVTVYNFGIGGYGVLQYRALLGRALELDPDWLIIGLYLPNDLYDVTKCQTELDAGCAWAREHGFEVPTHQTSLVQDVKTALTRDLALGSVLREIWTSHASAQPESNPDGVLVGGPRNPTFFSLPYARVVARRMDIDRPEIRAAFELLEDFLKRARRECENAGVELRVIMIPSKHSVYFEEFGASMEEGADVFREIVVNEDRLSQEIEAVFRRLAIGWVDVRPYLVRAIREQKGVYTVQGDDHPTALGYRIYARAARDSLGNARKR